MSLLFHTGNDSLSLKQLHVKRDANRNECLRLAEEFRRFETAHGLCSSVDTVDKNDLFGQMILTGLLEVDDITALAPVDRLHLAQRRYLDEELSHLIKMKSQEAWAPRPVFFHKSAGCIALDKRIGSLILSKDLDIQLTHTVSEAPPQQGIDEREEGELSDTEGPIANEVNNTPTTGIAVDTLPLSTASLVFEPNQNPFLDQIPEKTERPISPATVNISVVPAPAPVSAVITEKLPSVAPTLTKTDLGWQYYRRLESMSDEERTAEILTVRARHFSGDDKVPLLHLMPKFNPTTDAGILVTYGKLLPPNAMKISVADMKLIEAGRKLVGMDPEIPNRGKVSLNVRKLLNSMPLADRPAVSEAEVREVKQRYLLHHKGEKIVDLMPVFDPSTDLGKLIMWGEFIPPRAMQISTLHVNLIQQTRAMRGLHPILPYHQDSTTTSVPAAAHLNTAGGSFASQLSGYQNVNQYPVALHDLECAVLKLSDPELNAVEKRYVREYRGRTNHEIMPIFDPHCDLGRLILAGRKSMGKKIIVPPEHEQLLEESRAAVQQQRATIQRLLRRVQELESCVPVAQRVLIPPSWIALASDATLCTAPSQKSLAEFQELSKSGNTAGKRKFGRVDTAAASYYNTNKRPAGSRSPLMGAQGGSKPRQGFVAAAPPIGALPVIAKHVIDPRRTATAECATSTETTSQHPQQCQSDHSPPQNRTEKVNIALEHSPPCCSDRSNSNSSNSNSSGCGSRGTEGNVEVPPDSDSLSEAEKIRIEFERMKRGELRTSNDLKAKVKVFLFQKDEEEVLSDWLQYYSYMFGAENLVIIDHESQSQDVCRLLELYRLCGAEVITFSGSFERKHAVLTKEMLKHKNTFLLPLDADEFLVTDNSLSGNSSLPSLHVHRARLNQAFRKLPIDGRKYKFAYTYSARPNTTVCHEFVSSSKANATTDRSNRRTVTSQLALEKQPYFPRSKTFYYSEGFLYTDQGNHYGAVQHDHNVLNDHPTIGKNLSHYFAPLEASLLHYTMSSYNARKNKYVRGFAAYNFTLETDCSKEKNGLGYCKEAKYFLNSTDNGRNFYLQSCLSNQTGTSLVSVHVRLVPAPRPVHV